MSNVFQHHQEAFETSFERTRKFLKLAPFGNIMLFFYAFVVPWAIDFQAGKIIDKNPTCVLSVISIKFNATYGSRPFRLLLGNSKNLEI